MTKRDGFLKRYRRLHKAIKPYGLQMEQGRRTGHIAILDKDGRRVATMAGTPRVLANAEIYAWQSLKRDGHIPKDAQL